MNKSREGAAYRSLRVSSIIKKPQLSSLRCTSQKTGCAFLWKTQGTASTQLNPVGDLRWRSGETCGFVFISAKNSAGSNTNSKYCSRSLRPYFPADAKDP